jgi:peptidoglycan/LPS O-acetylase OafA/YrhL
LELSDIVTILSTLRSSQARASLDYRPDIDGLRAVAVLGVLLFHLDFVWIPGGYVGVDIFFVISGYLITKIIIEQKAKGEFSFLQFYQRRVRRLLPAFLVTLLATLVGAVLLFSPDHMERVGGAGLAALFSVSNFYFWQEAGYFDAASHLKPLLHSWSLSVEEQFYFLWPALLIMALTWGAKTRRPYGHCFFRFCESWSQCCFSKRL